MEFPTADIMPQSVGARLRSLKQERGEVEAKAKAFEAAGLTRHLTADENAKFDQLSVRLAELNGQIMEAERPARLSTAVPGGKRFREMFGASAISDGGWKSADEFFTTLQLGQSDPRLQFQATSTGTVPSLGRFSVPTQYFSQWLDDSLETEIVRPRCEVRPMTSDTALAIGWDGGVHSSTLYGGFSGQWVGQGGEITPEDPKLRIITLHANKLALLTQASNELLNDGIGYAQQIGPAMTKALGWFMDYTFLNGSGAGQPLGIINAPATVTVSKEGSQTAATINYQNLIKMFARLHPASMANAVWVVNPTTIPQLLNLTVTVGDGGSYIPVMSESNGQMRMLSIPILRSEKLPVLGTKGDVLLADFSAYTIGLRQDFSIDRSQHVGFTRDTSYFRGLLRADGQPKLAAPITPRHGDSLSPFVVLETRA